MKRTWVVVCLVLATVTIVGRGEARADEGCFMALKRCFIESAKIDSFIDRTFTALDCELDFVECARRKVGGW